MNAHEHPMVAEILIRQQGGATVTSAADAEAEEVATALAALFTDVMEADRRKAERSRRKAAAEPAGRQTMLLTHLDDLPNQLTFEEEP